MRVVRCGLFVSWMLVGCSSFGSSPNQPSTEDSGAASELDGGVVTVDPRDPTPVIASALPSLTLRQGSSGSLSLDIKPAGLPWKVGISTSDGIAADEVTADASGKATLSFVVSPSAPTTVRDATVTVRSPSGKSTSAKVSLDVRGKAGSVDPSFAAGTGKATGTGSVLASLADGTFLVLTSDPITEFESVPVLNHLFADGRVDTGFGQGGKTRLDGNGSFSGKTLAGINEVPGRLVVTFNRFAGNASDYVELYSLDRDGKNFTSLGTLSQSTLLRPPRPGVSVDHLLLPSSKSTGWALAAFDLSTKGALAGWPSASGTNALGPQPVVIDTFADTTGVHVFVKDTLDGAVGAVSQGLLDVSLGTDGAIRGTRKIPIAGLKGAVSALRLGSDDFVFAHFGSDGRARLVGWKDGVATPLGPGVDAAALSGTANLVSAADGFALAHYRPIPTGELYSPGPAVALFRKDGTPVSTFGTNGIATFEDGPDFDTRRIARSVDGRSLLVALGHQSNTTFALLRIWL